MTAIQRCERWAFIEGQCVEVPGTYSWKAMAVEYHNIPIMERWSDNGWRFMTYNYLGGKPMFSRKIPPALRALQLIL